MADDPIEEYAQLENNHILLQLVGARPPTGEDPVELAERNVGATERSFGCKTALHAMALNTYAFALMYKSQNGAAAQPQAEAAVAILKVLGGQNEMLLEARMLAAQARMLAGAKPLEAVANAFELPFWTGRAAGLRRGSGGMDRQTLRDRVHAYNAKGSKPQPRPVADALDRYPATRTHACADPPPLTSLHRYRCPHDRSPESNAPGEQNHTASCQGIPCA